MFIINSVSERRKEGRKEGWMGTDDEIFNKKIIIIKKKRSKAI